MTLSKKWLATGLTSILLASLLAGCPSNKTAPDQAFKDAYIKMLSESYNYEGNISVEVKSDDQAILGTKGGLSEQEAQEELDFSERLKTQGGKSMIAALQSVNVVFHGAFDNKNMKYDAIFNTSYVQEGIKISFDLPLLIDLKEDPTLYIDPKAGGILQFDPTPLNGKLLKISLSDVEGLTPEQKAKFKANGSFFQKSKEFVTTTLNSIDPKAFKDINISDEAKKAGASRTIQVTLTATQTKAVLQSIFDQYLTSFGTDFNLAPERIAQEKKQFAMFIEGQLILLDNTTAEYSLNDQGKIVYISNALNFKGAKHTGKINSKMTLKDFGKPVLTIDSSKQGSMTLAEVMKIIGAVPNNMVPPQGDVDIMVPEAKQLEQ